MRIIEVQLKKFKYFDNLTLRVPDGADVVVLLGQNGTGKSSIFDAFNYIIKKSKDRNSYSEDDYYFKQTQTTEKQQKIDIRIKLEDGKEITPQDQQEFKRIYGRSAYRFTSQIDRNQIGSSAAQQVNSDGDRAHRSIDRDDRLENDVEFALFELLELAQSKGEVINNIEMRDKIIQPTANSLKRVLGSDLGFEEILTQKNSSTGKLDLLFKKSYGYFSYRVLSAGEKEIFNIIFNFHRRKEQWIRDGIYFLDEPELHLNTSIQKNLFKEIARLCREVNAQCWFASHSIGFMRAAQENVLDGDGKNVVIPKEKISILKFEETLSSGQQIVVPKKLAREDWVEIFKVALDDLTYLIVPKIIIYCEGKKLPDQNGKEDGLDAQCYTAIFSEQYPDAHFISSGGNTELNQNAAFGAIILQKIFIEPKQSPKILILKDGDTRNQFNDNAKKLVRRELENYLFDKEVLQLYKSDADLSFLDNVNICDDDLKPLQPEIKDALGYKGDIKDLKVTLAKYINKDSNIYSELENIIFG